MGPDVGGEWETPYGPLMPMTSYALAADRHMAQYGTTSEQLAQIAVDTRRWAAMNPRARYRDPITVDDVLASPVIGVAAAPARLLPAHRRRRRVRDDLGRTGAATSRAHRCTCSARRPVSTTGSSRRCPTSPSRPGAISGPAAFAHAGIAPDDVDVLQAYDSFTITALLHLEDLGFCAKGEGGAFVEDGKLGPGGALPMNTNGGGLSYTHPGQYGMFLLVEAARQLRGEAGQRQVPDAEVAVAHGCGGVLSATGTVVLGTEATL